MNEMFVIAVLMQLLLLGVIALFNVAAEKKGLTITTIIALLLLIGIIVSSEEYGIAKTDLPQENLPFFVKSIRMEGSNDVYMEIVPYNDINASKQLRYKIPAEKYQLANITAGMVIINEGGTIKPFPINPKV